MGRNLFISLLMVLFCSAAQGEIYKWVDHAGRVFYSDTPPNDQAEKVELSEPTIYTSKKGSSSSGNDNEEAKENNNKNYSEFSISYPANKGTVRNVEELIITFKSNPYLHKGDYIQLIVDGNILTSRITSLSYPLENLTRGTHFLQASIMDRNGRMKIRAKVVQFYFHKDTVIEDGKAPELPDSGESGDDNVDAPQFKPGATPDYQGDPATPGVDNPEFKPGATPDYQGDPATPGVDNPGYTPKQGGISHTPGQTNPAFTPK